MLVGLDKGGATAWAAPAGSSWTQAPAQPDLAVPYAAGAMTSVTTFGDEFIAGGYRDDPLHATASAAVWRSLDGLTWHVDDGAGTFAGGRIWGVAARGGTLVAVGTGGDPNYGPAAAWRWTRDAGWQRGHIGPDAGGAMRAVAVTPSGFLAVGLNGHDDGALAWTSPDGLDWTASPDQPAFHYFTLPLRMQSVVAGPGRTRRRRLALGRRKRVGRHVDLARWRDLAGADVADIVLGWADHRTRSERQHGGRRGQARLSRLEPGGDLGEPRPLSGGPDLLGIRPDFWVGVLSSSVRHRWPVDGRPLARR